MVGAKWVAEARSILATTGLTEDPSKSNATKLGGVGLAATSLYKIRSSRGFRDGKLRSRPPCPNAEGIFARRKLAIGCHVVLIERRILTASFDDAQAGPGPSGVNTG